MKTAFLVLLAFPLMVLAQTKNVLSIERVFPKIEKAAEFNKALANHAQKYHTGSWKWRVYDITTGPDYGGVMIVEGPNSWTDIDKRGDISAEHMDDWNKNIAPLILQNQQSQMLEYEETLSSVPLTAFTKWINITHLYQNPGYTGVTTDLIKQLKALWTAENETVAVYTVASSGAQQFSLVTRYKDGLSQRDMIKPSLPERFVKVNGAAAWSAYLSNFQRAIDKTWSELLMYREDLSSK